MMGQGRGGTLATDAQVGAPPLAYARDCPAFPNRNAISGVSR